MAVSRSNWLFAGSLRAGQRAAAIMSLIQTPGLTHFVIHNSGKILPRKKLKETDELGRH